MSTKPFSTLDAADYLETEGERAIFMAEATTTGEDAFVERAREIVERSRVKYPPLECASPDSIKGRSERATSGRVQTRR